MQMPHVTLADLRISSVTGVKLRFFVIMLHAADMRTSL